MKMRTLLLALAAAVVAVSAAVPADAATRAPRCLKVLTREGTKTYCGGGYVDLHGNVYEKRKKAAFAPSPGPQGPVHVDHPVTVNTMSRHGGRH